MKRQSPLHLVTVAATIAWLMTASLLASTAQASAPSDASTTAPPAKKSAKATKKAAKVTTNEAGQALPTALPMKKASKNAKTEMAPIVPLNDDPVDVLEPFETSPFPIAEEKKVLEKQNDEINDHEIVSRSPKMKNLKTKARTAKATKSLEAQTTLSAAEAALENKKIETPETKTGTPTTTTSAKDANTQASATTNLITSGASNTAPVATSVQSNAAVNTPQSRSQSSPTSESPQATAPQNIATTETSQSPTATASSSVAMDATAAMAAPSLTTEQTVETKAQPQTYPNVDLALPHKMDSKAMEASLPPAIIPVMKEPTPLPIEATATSSLAETETASADSSNVVMPLREEKTEASIPLTTPTVTSRLETRPTKASGEPANRVFLRGSYLGARYSELESRLQDGATSIGLSLTHELEDSLELRAGADVTHGMDQSVTPENIRMITARVELAKFFRTANVLPFVSGGVGYSNYSVRSVRSVDGANITVKRHASDSAMALIPAGGVRFEIAPRLAIDLQVEYLGLVGGEHSASVGGLEGTAALGFKF